MSKNHSLPFLLLPLLILLLMTPGLSAQDQAVVVDQATVDIQTGHASPRDAMAAFLGAMNRVDDGNEDALSEALACFDFPDSITEGERREVTEQMLDVLNRFGRIDMRTLPGRNDVSPPSDSGDEPITRYQFFPLPRFAWVTEKLASYGTHAQGKIVLEADDSGVWRFNRRTVTDIPGLHESTAYLPMSYGDQNRLVQADVAKLIGPTFTLTPNWAWGVLLGAIFLGLLAGKIVQSILRAASKRWIERGWEVRGIMFDNAASPASFTLLSMGLWFGIHYIHREPKLAEFSNNIIEFLLIVAVGWFLFNLVEVIDAALRRLSEKTESKLDDQLVPLVRKALRLFLVVIFTLFVAQNVFGLNITGWLAGLGIAGLAVSLAAQDSIKNLFGSITVLFDKPFTVGDWIVTEGLEGTVEEVGFRSTRIRTFYNSLITLPNANLINASVDNYGRRQFRRWKTHIGVQYDTTPDQLVAFTEGIRELVRSHPYTRKDYFQVWCHEFGASSLNILIYIFHEVPDWSTELRERERLFIDIVRLADKLGVSFAFPTQTVHLYKEEHAEYQTQHDTPQSMTERRARISGIRGAQQLIKDQPWQTNKPGPVVFTKGPTDLKIDEHGNPVIEKEES
jgi:MscS family membrane protein